MFAYGVHSRWDMVVAKFVVLLNVASPGLLLQWFICVQLCYFFVRDEGQICSLLVSDGRNYSAHV